MYINTKYFIIDFYVPNYHETYREYTVSVDSVEEHTEIWPWVKFGDLSVGQKSQYEYFAKISIYA